MTRKSEYRTLDRAPSTYRTFHDFDLAKAEGYKQQYGDLYFLRLAKLKPSVEAIASEAWADFEVGTNSRASMRQVNADKSPDRRREGTKC